MNSNVIDSVQPLTRRLRSRDRDQENMGWVASARSFPGREWAAHEAVPFPVVAITEDVVDPGRGFGAHDHQDMEIVSYVIAGELEHTDSFDNRAVLRHGDLQIMTAGRGIQHSEMNSSSDEPVHFLQIWILPDRVGLAPAYAHAIFYPAAPVSLLAGPSSGLTHLNQTVEIWRLAPAREDIAFDLPSGARAWVHIVRGGTSVDGTALSAGDGIAIRGQSALEVHAATRDAEMLIFVETGAVTR